MVTKAEETVAGTAVPQAQRRRRASVGGLKQKLDAPKREGYVRRWVDNDPSRIAAMEDLGYAFVADRAGAAEKRTDGMGTRIARHAGKRADGAPHQLVLMETPVAEYALGIKDKEDQLRPFEDALKSGADTTGRMTDTYEVRDRSSITHSS